MFSLSQLILGDFTSTHSTAIECFRRGKRGGWCSAEKALVPADAGGVSSKPPLISLMQWCKE